MSKTSELIGIRQARLPLNTGSAVFEWPSPLGDDDKERIQAWVEIVMQAVEQTPTPQIPHGE